jgi:hypothetical protein
MDQHNLQCSRWWGLRLGSGGESMNQFLSGTALAAALVFAAPVWAQTPTTPNPAGAPSTTAPYTQSAPSTTTQAAPYAQQQQPSTSSAAAPAASSTREPMPEQRATKRMGHAAHMRSTHQMRHARLRHRGSRAPSDTIANQLNRQELGRISGSSSPPATNAPEGYPQQGQPPSSSGR